MNSPSISLEQLVPLNRLHSVLRRFCTSIELGCRIVGIHGEIVFEADWNHSDRQEWIPHSPKVSPKPTDIGHLLERLAAPPGEASLLTDANGSSSIGIPLFVDEVPVAIICIGPFVCVSGDSGQMNGINLGGEQEREGEPAPPDRLPVLSGQRVAELSERLAIMAEFMSEMARTALLERNTVQQLQQSEERYRSLIDSFPLVIYETDREGRVVFANTKTLEYFGCTQVELDQGVHLSSFLPPHEHPKAAQRLNMLLAGHQLEPEEFTFPRKQGSSSSALVYCRPIKVGSEITGVRGIFVDITRRKEAEKMLSSSEQRYRALFEVANDAILLLARGKIVECNDEAIRLFQRSKEDLIGANLADLSPSLQANGQPSEGGMKRWSISTEQDRRQRFDWDILLPDGSTRETEVSLSSFDLADELYLLALFRDMTEHNQNRRTLEEQKSAWQVMFENAPFGIVINRLRDGVYLDVNPAFEQYGGRRRTDILGKTVEDLLLPDQREKSRLARQALLAGDCIANQESVTIGTDGTERHILYSSAAFQSNGEPCAVSMFVDITERKKMEAKIRHNEAVLNSLFQAVPVGLALIKDRRFLAVNERLAAITGYAPADLLHRPLHFLYESKEEYLRVGSALYDTLWERGVNYVESRFKRQDGSFCHVSLFTAPVDPNNPEAGAAGAIQDIGERTAMLQSLRDSEHRFRKTAELSGQIIYDYDVASGNVLWSGRIEAITGYSSEEFNSLGFAGWVDRICPDDRTTTLARLEESSRDRTVFSADYRFLRADGTYIHVHGEGAYLYDERGNAVRMLGTIKDVSSQKAAEEALRRSEGRLTLAISAATDAIWEWYPQSRHSNFSPRWYEMLGYGKRELPMTYNGWTEYCHPDDLEGTIKALKAVLDAPDNAQFEIEYRLRHRDGHWVWMLTRGKVMERDLAGTPLLVTGTHADITSRKLAEIALRESERRYRTLFESGSDAIFILKDNVVADCNNKTLEMFRCTRDQFIGLSPQQFSPSMQPDGRTFAEHGKEHIDKALLGCPQQFQWVHTRLDGIRFHADVRLGAVELSGKVCVQAIIRDISEWKRTEGALRESEFRFRSFFNTSPEGILLIDFHGKIIDANRAFLQESGYSLQESVHKHFGQFVPSDDQTRIVAAILAFKSGVARNQPLRFSYIAKDGSLVPVQAKGWLVVDEKSIPLYLGVFIHNLSKEIALAEEKAMLEKQVIQSQRSEAIGTLAGGIAHDFNNILGGVIGYTELALYRSGSAMDAKIREYLQRVLEGGNRAKDLVQQILRFSRHSATVMEPINLVPVIKESIRLLRSTLPSTISIRHHLEQDMDRILGDATQIHQVIMNLGTNALHAMKENGGQLTITLKNVFIDEPRQFMSMSISAGEYLHIQVGDTGSGMSPAVVERIFEPYFTTKKVNEGTGLGMAVVLGIIKSHKGLIEINTTVGTGTQFDIYLPLTHDDATPNNGVAALPPMGRGERVLLVDDEPFFLEVIRESLQLLRYHVTACTSSSDALRMFSSTPHDFDLLITDQTMPEMTGVQLVREVRRLDDKLPIILCTGYSEIVSEQSAAYYGISQFLMKPVNTAELAKAVAAVLAR